MGCDGGTIPTRDELVRLKKKPEQKDKDAERAAKWKHCAITQQPLVMPIMSCELGRLYNKESVLEFLLDKSKFESAANFEHIRGLKDVKELKLTDNVAYSKSTGDKGDYYVDRHAAQFICPVTGLEMSGKYKFCYLLGCGCVFSERAMKEVKSEICHKCGKAFKKEDIVILNGTEEEMEQMRANMDNRRLQAKLEKKAKRKQAATAAAAESSAAEGPSSSKQSKPESGDKPSTSKMTKSKLANGFTDHKSTLTNGKTADKYRSVQKDPQASNAYKSLFTSSDACKNQPKGHWVTHNPQYY